jgi:predicted amidohydrolase
MQRKSFKLALLQMETTSNKANNLKKAEEMVRSAAA